MDYLRSLYLIYNSDRKYKWALLRDYIRLLISSWLQSRNLKKETYKTYFLGQQIHYPQLSSLIFLIQEIFIHECYNTPFKDTDKIVDIGSHIGISILYFHLNYPNTRIDAYELNPETYTYLKTNIFSNKLKNINTFNKGVSTHSGEKYLKTQKSDLNSSISDSPTKTKIEIIDILSILDSPNTILKIDVEGHENQLIEYLFKIEKNHFIKKIIVETEKNNTFIPQTLSSNGFVKIDHKNSFYTNLPEEIQVYKKN